MSTLDEGARAAVEGSWPVLPRERTWGSVALLGVCVSASVATWIFITGGFVAFYLPAGQGAITMIAGSLFGILLIILALLRVTTRYGIDSVAASTPQLGTRGSYFALALTYCSVIGWNTLLLVFLGRAAAEILISTGVAGEGARQPLIVVFGLLGVVAAWMILRGGPARMRNIAPAIAAGVVVLAVVLLIALITNVGWDTIADAPALAPAESQLFNYVTGFELLVASMLSWWPYVGGTVRLAPGTKTALWPTVFGLGLAISLLSMIGLFAALAVPESGGDPTTYLVEVGGLWLGLPALAFIILANVATTMVGVYVSALALKQIPTLQTRLSWNAATALTLAPVVIVVLLAPNWVFDNFGTFLAFIGVVFAPLCGIQIMDYVVFRKHTLDLRAVFLGRRGDAYHYWAGFNPAGFAGLLAGAGTYIYLLDPILFVSRTPYEYLSASLPSALVAGILYGLITKFVIMPAGLGGYSSPVMTDPRQASFPPSRRKEEVSEPTPP